MEEENSPVEQLSYRGNKAQIEVVDANKFIVLYMLSCGLYGIWWMYKSWTFFKERESRDIQPVWRAIFAIFFLYGLMERIKEFAISKSYESNYPSLLLFIGILVLNAFARLPDPFWLIALGSGFLYIPSVSALYYALENSPEYEVVNPQGYNKRQMAIIVIGSVWWLLVMIGLSES